MNSFSRTVGIILVSCLVFSNVSGYNSRLIISSKSTNKAGACASQDDISIVSNYSNIESEVESCSISCVMGSTDYSECTSACISKATGISSNCADCYGTTSKCAINNCFFKCMYSSSDQMCVSCMKSYCTSVYETCSGLQFASAVSSSSSISSPSPSSSSSPASMFSSTRKVLDHVFATSGACNNTEDLSKLQDREIVQLNYLDCTEKQCISTESSQQEFSVCTSKCFVEKSKVSNSCATCFGNYGTCSKTYCAEQCTDPLSAECASCSSKRCYGQFKICSDGL